MAETHFPPSSCYVLFHVFFLAGTDSSNLKILSNYLTLKGNYSSKQLILHGSMDK